MPIYQIIIACEAAFWLFLTLGLIIRYGLAREALSRSLLLSLPLLDVLLLGLTALDLRAGHQATTAHALATVYAGFTLAFGSVAIARLDRRFACWFARGPQPIPAPSEGWPAVRYELVLWIRCIVAWIVAAGLLFGLLTWSGSSTLARMLPFWLGFAIASVGAWFIFGPLWSLVAFLRGPDIPAQG